MSDGFSDITDEDISPRIAPKQNGALSPNIVRLNDRLDRLALAQERRRLGLFT